MANVEPGNVRNTGLLGHGGVGKTILIEHMLHLAGKTNRIGKIQEGNTAGDYLQEEIQRQHTIQMKLFNFDWQGKHLFLVDHPGLSDFLGEVASSMPLLDGAVIVVDATTGIQVGTDNAFKYADNYGTPRAIFVNKLDRDNTSFEEVVQAIQDAYGHRCVPFTVPVGSGAALSGVVNVLNGDSEGAAVDVEAMKSSLVDAVAESDDALLEKYLEAGELSPEELSEGLQRGIASGKIVPILAGSAEKEVGIKELLDLVSDSFPSPLERIFKAADPQEKVIEIKASPDAPFVAQVFRTVVDPYVGQLTLFRVLTGTLRSDSEFVNNTTGSKERTGKIFLLNGKEQTQVDAVVPGELAAMTKLKNTHFADTIAAPGNGNVMMPKITLPVSMVKLAIVPKSRADEDKIGEALNRLADDDPTFSHFRDPATREHIIRGLGDQQLEILLDRMLNKFHVEAETHVPKVAYKETIKSQSEVQGKHKKQTGGHGQYGDVHVRFKPNERGGGYQFVDSIVGGVVPKQYIPAVDKGIQETLLDGVIAGYPVVDIIAELYYGSYHDVDSSEMAFKTAARLAVNKGVKEAKPVLLEPITIIEVTVPEEYMGDINGDLNSRRGRILGMESIGGGRQVIRAQVPEAEVLRYSTDLRSMTGGRGSYALRFSHYDEVPEHVAQNIIAAYQKEKAAAE